MAYTAQNANGQATAANSSPVVLASDVPVVVAGSAQTYSYSVSSVTPGTVYDVGSNAWVSVHILTQYTGTSPVTVWQVSNDGTNWVSAALEQSSSLTTPAVNSTTGSGVMFHGPLSGRYFRLNFTGTYTSGAATGTIAFFSLPRTPQSFGVAAVQSGTWGVGVAAQATGGYSNTNITTAATTTAKSGAGTLHALVVNTPAAGTITVYDNTTATGAKLHTFTVTAGQPFAIPLDSAFATGLTVVTSAVMDVSVLWK